MLQIFCVKRLLGDRIILLTTSKFKDRNDRIGTGASEHGSKLATEKKANKPSLDTLPAG